MKRIALLIISVLAFVFLAAACGSDDDVAIGPGAQPSPNPASGGGSDAPSGRWILQFLLIEGDMAIPLPEQPVELRIDGTALGGDGGCNSIGGTAQFDASGALSIDEMFLTEMACFPPEVMDFEQRYTQALLGTTEWQLDGEQLILRGPNAEITYTPRIAPPDLPITGTTWRVDTFFDGAAAMNAAGMEDVTVSFTDTGVQMRGRCWTISGIATVEPGGEGNLSADFSTADPGFTCDDRSFFEDMMERMSSVNEYEVIESRLTLSTSGSPVLGLIGGS